MSANPVDWQLLLFAMLPVAAYAGLRGRGVAVPASIGAATAVAALELGVNSLRLGRVELFSLLSLLLFAVMGGIALLRRDERLFKLQPAALDLCLAAVFLYAWHVQEVPLFQVILERHVRLFEALPAYQQGYASLYATTLSRSLPYLLLVHAALTADAALRRSNAWWFLVRVPGFYALLAALFFAERILGVKP